MRIIFEDRKGRGKGSKRIDRADKRDRKQQRRNKAERRAAFAWA